MTDEAKAQLSDRACLFWVLGAFATAGISILVVLFAVAYQNSRP